MDQVFEVIGTLLVARKIERFFCRQASALEYGVFRKDYFTQLSPSVPCVLSVSVCSSSVCGGRRPCPSVVRLLIWGGINTPSQVARYLVAGVLTGVGCGDQICASDGTEMFGWMMFGEIIGQVVLSSFPIHQCLFYWRNTSDEVHFYLI